jgi:hypothetical protein
MAEKKMTIKKELLNGVWWLALYVPSTETKLIKTRKGMQEKTIDAERCIGNIGFIDFVDEGRDIQDKVFNAVRDAVEKTVR